MDEVMIADIMTAVVFMLAVVLGLAFGAYMIFRVWELITVMCQSHARKKEKKGAKNENGSRY